MGLQLFFNDFFYDCCEVFLLTLTQSELVKKQTNLITTLSSLADVEKLQKSNREFDTVSCNPIKSSYFS